MSNKSPDAKVMTSADAAALPVDRTREAARASLAAAFALGLGLVFLVGFAHSTVLHDAAHDSRHTLAFPCH
jgi:cobalt transporter subunit CbtB